jgi:aryl-alcohol dehydrogenase-like predicted oxidoreductase
MEYVNLGQAGVKVSRIALGMMTYGTSKWRPWVLDEDISRPFIRRALDLGINFFDTADMYSLGESEAVLGRSLRYLGIAREKVVVATKVFFPVGDDLNQRGLSRKHIMHAIDNSLRRLQTDYVDLYQIHRFDRHTPIEETLDALTDVVRAGKALYLGACSMFAWQFARMLYTASRLGLTRFVTMQNHYNIIYREEEREMMPLCRAEGIGVLPWSPLARGFVTGTRHRPVARNGGEKPEYGDTLRANTDDYGQTLYYRDEDFQVVDCITQVAKQRGVANVQVALAWLLQQPGVTAPIVGASKLAQLDELVKAIDLKLTEEELETLNKPYRPHPVLGHH